LSTLCHFRGLETSTYHRNDLAAKLVKLSASLHKILFKLLLESEIAIPKNGPSPTLSVVPPCRQFRTGNTTDVLLLEARKSYM
jgi:hypothetical protein